MRKLSVLVFVLVGSLVVGCDGGNSPTTPATATMSPAAAPPAASSPPSAATGPASAGHPTAAKPGSYEDWCVEHDVPESQCTRCDKSLVPAFKATKDWCKEHDLPESHCRTCNPGLRLTRPPKEGPK
ncbi:MAG: hypothetical protein HY815_31740 [Candidatus Riflebacteria bacterium]|nr:hypothetical protein [Candidatus Riflebacteria bacterium]